MKGIINFTETETYLYPRIVFRPVKEVIDNPDKLASTTLCDQNDGLLFKQLKCDGKLIKQTFIENGFQQTEAHDWNVMWFNSAAKPHVYNDLNEYQKVNHFPNSYEIT